MKLDNFLKKLISLLFPVLFFLVPLFFTPVNSELFEFNKIILVYLATTLIVGTWLARMILQKKKIFKKTPFDIPLLLFLASQIISTLFSIDRHTSLFGYYSRFNGSLLSTICYLLLYWAFVSNCTIDDVKKTIKFSLISAAIVSVYGVLEHFGYSFSCLLFTGKFNVSCWVQDVQNRVFATLGQPNWLAAYIAALMPISWALMLMSNVKCQMSKPNLKTKIFNSTTYYLILNTCYFACLLFTDSRSGFLGLAVSAIVFWGILFLQNRNKERDPSISVGMTGVSSFRANPERSRGRSRGISLLIKPFLILNTGYLILIFVFGSPFPQINKYFSLKSLVSHFSTPTSRLTSQLPPSPPTDTQIVIGGTESSAIRKIVWQGAIDIFKHYPLFGSGVETFAYSYYNFRPLAHNLVSEWDFLYNKAHNEYLNYLSTTGIFGLGTYLLFIIFFTTWNFIQLKAQSSKLKTITKNSKLAKENFLLLTYNFDFCLLTFALFSGWLSLLVTNFFGFSVVVTSLYFFLIPAFVVVLTSSPAEASAKAGHPQPTSHFSLSPLLLVLLFFIFYFLFFISRLWRADFYYTKGKKLNEQSEYQQAITYLAKAVVLSPSEPVFQSDASSILASLAYLTKDTNASSSADLGQKAIALSDLAINISPKNLNLWKTRVKVFYTLSTIEEKYLVKAIESIQYAIKLAPTDPKLVYNLGLLYGKTGDIDKALATIKRSVELKPNYADARNALSIYYEDLKQPQKAVEQLEYILKYISPDSQEAKERLERLKK